MATKSKIRYFSVFLVGELYEADYCDYHGIVKLEGVESHKNSMLNGRMFMTKRAV